MPSVLSRLQHDTSTLNMEVQCSSTETTRHAQTRTDASHAAFQGLPTRGSSSRTQCRNFRGALFGCHIRRLSRHGQPWSPSRLLRLRHILFRLAAGEGRQRTVCCRRRGGRGGGSASCRPEGRRTCRATSFHVSAVALPTSSETESTSERSCIVVAVCRRLPMFSLSSPRHAPLPLMSSAQQTGGHGAWR